MIYLISTDGYRDSLDLSFYATNADEIKKLVYQYRKEYFTEEFDLDSFEVDLSKLEVKFKTKADWDDVYEEYTYKLIKLHKI